MVDSVAEPSPDASVKTDSKGGKLMSETPTFGRYAEVPYDRMTPEQQEGYKAMIEARGRLPGPTKIWVHNPKLAKVAGDIDGLAITCDVGLEEDVKALVAAAEDKYGQVDVFFSNAGLSRKGQESASDADWDVSWRVHVMSHVFAARALVPGMLARGSGYLLNTASAAGLLASLNSMPYGVTKNAAFTWGVVVNPRDGLAYVNDYNNGLWVVKVEPKPAPVP